MAEEQKMENAEMYQRDLMEPQHVYALDRALVAEQDIRENLDPYARFQESTFRRQGLPILSGLIDDTFDQNSWTSFVGSPFVPVQIVSDDLTKVLFTIPALNYTGQTLMHVEGQPSLTDESMEIERYAQLMPTAGEKAKHDLIVNTLDGIDKVAYETNRRRAFNVIKLLNWIYERYGLKGRIAFPQGMEDLLGSPTATVAPTPVQVQQATAAAEMGDGGIDDYEDL
ncbi:hypothetical protein BIZ78_gp244 [Erwinia phage vB_EamM_Caitlin]|uniref:hypothetical protein n=1 Tax=Erwinia phage vB_EamM_Caitlin TaxID=1883379 RepID=UPI00081CA4BC|nr:hypothetical protein BIZ78_gp244 [Erwinia phage vB_EamM_Caitlin]ANZ48331.1 hypothetical protein CAITLIN_36 [Erwinia phage vB_EamM_Caitlin]